MQICHVKYDLKQAKWAKIVLEMHSRAQKKCAFSEHMVVWSSMVWCSCTSLCQKFGRMCCSLCMIRQTA